MGRRQRDVDVARLADRLAVVEAFEHGELAGTLLHDAGDPEKVFGPLGTGHRTPDHLLGAPGGLDGPVDVFDAGRRDLRQHLLGGRVLGLVGLGVDRLDKGPVDEQPVRGPEVHDRAGLRSPGIFENLLRALARDGVARGLADSRGLVLKVGNGCILAVVGVLVLTHSMLKSSLPA